MGSIKKNYYKNYNINRLITITRSIKAMRLDQIKKLVVTEKSVRLFENQQYVFDVDPSLNKTEIRNFVERHFEVNVTSVNTHRLPSKRTKRAIVTLAPGNSLSILGEQGLETQSNQ